MTTGAVLAKRTVPARLPIYSFRAREARTMATDDDMKIDYSKVLKQLQRELDGLDEGISPSRRSRIEDDSVTRPPPLSRRQREIAELVAQGFTNKDICAATGLSRRRVEDIIQTIALRLALNPTRNFRVQIALYIRQAA